MEYKIIYIEASTSFGAAFKKIEKEINDHLKDGWSLKDSLSIVSHNASDYFVVSQVMIRNKE